MVDNEQIMESLQSFSEDSKGLVHSFSGKDQLNSILDEIGVGTFHWKLMVICGCGWLADNGWVQTISLIVPAIQKEFGIEDWELGFLGSALFLGMAAGSHVWGRLSDKIGRRLAFNATLAIAGCMGIIASFSVNYYMLIIFYFLLGTGVGGNLPVDGAMFAEFTPKQARGKLMVLLSVFWSVGGFFVSLFAWVLIPRYGCDSKDDCHASSNLGWRFVVGGFGAVNLLSLLFRTGLPETPAFLCSKGEISRARDVLRRIAQSNAISPSHRVYRKIDGLVVDRPELLVGDHDSHIGCSELFVGRYMKATTYLLWGIWFFSTYGFTGFNLFLTKLFEYKNIHAGSLYRDALVYSAAGVPGSLLGAYLVDTQLGRIWTMVMSTAITVVCLLFFLLVSNEAQIIAISCLVNISSMVMFAAYYTYTPEVYRTAVRGRGVGIASGLSRVAGVLAPLVNSGLLALGSGIFFPMIVNTAAMGIATVCMSLLPIKTKGRTLE